ncbi:MAG: ribosome biogenesis GTP-binding protein YihA/YsxC [Gammaproteobacteria bacterium]|nr:ribosome biogenesis GTP-binding protein YihA/YsxC [Gammaproteobacteria bacterium]
MNTYYKRLRFLISAAAKKQFPDTETLEIAFAGRSNAGKSSAINALADNKNIARTSKTPGRTQLINFFSLDESRLLVDLPGYGFAKVPPRVKKQWLDLMESYLADRPNIVGLVIIMDIRHPLKEFDWKMLEWCAHFNIPAHVLLTKADKLKKGPAKATLLQVQKYIKEEGLQATVQMFSALKKLGISELHQQLDQWLGLPLPEQAKTPAPDTQLS